MEKVKCPVCFYEIEYVGKAPETVYCKGCGTKYKPEDYHKIRNKIEKRLTHPTNPPKE